MEFYKIDPSTREIININLKIIFLENSELIKVVFFSKKFIENFFWSKFFFFKTQQFKYEISSLLYYL